MTQDAQGRVIITSEEIYRLALNMSAKLDLLVARSEQHDIVIAQHDIVLRPLGLADKQLSDHETRLRTLERLRWPLASIGAVVAVMSLGMAAIPLLK